jgi:hypothetical protein
VDDRCHLDDRELDDVDLVSGPDWTAANLVGDLDAHASVLVGLVVLADHHARLGTRLPEMVDELGGELSEYRGDARGVRRGSGGARLGDPLTDQGGADAYGGVLPLSPRPRLSYSYTVKTSRRPVPSAFVEERSENAPTTSTRADRHLNGRTRSRCRRMSELFP